jgi:HPt (histidine-containing phosphotransfer) domain-containing protein
VQAEELWQAIGDLTPVPRPPEPEPPIGEPAEPLDPARMLSRVAGDAGLLREVVGLFLVDCPRLLGQMREAVVGESAPQLRLAAHTLKGSMDFFGARAAFALARKLEMMGQDGKMDDARETLQALEEQIDRLIPVLRTFVEVPQSRTALARGEGAG